MKSNNNSRSQNIHKLRGYDRDRGDVSNDNNNNNRGNRGGGGGGTNNANNSMYSPLNSNALTQQNLQQQNLQQQQHQQQHQQQQHNLNIQRNVSLRTSSLQSLPETQLSAKPHAFSGAVLNPKQARDLTPKIVLNITHTLGNYALDAAGAYATHGPNSHSAESAESNNDNNNGNNNNNDGEGNKNNKGDNGNNANEAKVQYTVWITEAWRCLGWAEPSAALFWEMATMYHTLHVAARSIEVIEQDSDSPDGDGNGDGDDNGSQYMGIQRTLSQSIPPILSCGSSASMESVETKKKERDREKERDRDGTGEEKSSSPQRLGSPDGRNSKHSPNKKNSTSSSNSNNDKSKTSHNNKSAASAKELPVWLVGMYLLLHCEEGVFRRNVSGEDAQRFDALMAKQQGAGGSPGGGGVGEIWKDGKGVDFGMLLMQPLRAHLHGGWMDNTNCTIYLLRHLRKFLLLSAVPHNADAQIALESLFDSVSTHDKEYSDRQNPSSSRSSQGSSSSSLIDPYGNMDADEILRRHDEEHGDFGLQVTLTTEDLERLNFVLQAPSGGLIDDPPMYISDLMPAEELAVYGGLPLEEVEREIRQHLEIELLNGGNDDSKSQLDDANDNDVNVDSTTNDMGKLDLNEGDGGKDEKLVGKGRAEVSHTDYHKELKYSRVRGKTILLKPNHTHSMLRRPVNNSTGNNNTNNDPSMPMTTSSPSLSTNGRLHDVLVAECSDAHMYLLQSFEHATISACSNCTIVVGAVAGLLHVVDCEKMTITSAARRILVSNCNDVSHYIFTPSPPLLVGINRNCQFAPYNTYYDGFREDLLATGLAGAVVSADNVVIDDSIHGPALQCASNKWKQPVELNKICDVLKMHSMPKSGAYADDKVLSKGTNEDTMQTPTLVPASEFQVLFVPFESQTNKERRAQQEANAEEMSMQYNRAEENSPDGHGPRIGSLFCNCLADVLQLSPFRLPTEYERRISVKADRMRSLQQLIETHLTPEQQLKLEEELNRGFRDWLVTSGNLRQVLDLVHLESKMGA